jgi:hypothetical protein
MDIDLDELLGSWPVEVFALGEPAQCEPAFARMRDQIFAQLVERGFQAVAVDNRRLWELARPGTVRVAGSVGASAALGLPVPAPDTYEGVLGAAVGHGPLFVGSRITARVRADTAVGYLPLDAETVANCDAILHLDRFPAAAGVVADRIAALPGVAQQQAGPGLESPEVCWDERFFFVGDDRRRPFATIVGHDLAGFDERSQLDRVGVYRLNIELGRRRFEKVFGFAPAAAASHDYDFTAFDQLVPHPVYGMHGWASVLNPSYEKVEDLIEHAHGRRRISGR